VAGAVHKNEYVIPADGLRNPKVSAFANIIEVARRNNQLARLDLSPSFAAYSSGGFTSNTPIVRGESTPQSTPQGEPLTDILQRVAIALDENTKQTRRLESWKPKVYSELIKKDIDMLNDIQKNRGL
jgi:hypothetical protein